MRRSRSRSSIASTADRDRLWRTATGVFSVTLPIEDQPATVGNGSTKRCGPFRMPRAWALRSSRRAGRRSCSGHGPGQASAGRRPGTSRSDFETKAASQRGEFVRAHQRTLPGHGSLVSSVGPGGLLRWRAYRGPLDAGALVDCTRRLTLGSSRKVFLIVRGMRLENEAAVRQWPVEHQDDIEAGHVGDPDSQVPVCRPA